jgi:hypothetical protein
MIEQEYGAEPEEQVHDEPDTQDVSPEVEEAEVVEYDEPDGKPVKDWSSEEEQEARAFGWKPRDEWQGRVPDGFIDDPKAFIDRAMTFKPFRTLYERLENVERQGEEKFRKLEHMAQMGLQAQRKQYEARLDNIRQQKAQAVEMADTAAYKRLEGEEQATQQAMWQSMAEPQPQQPRGFDPWTDQYRKTDDGQWINNPQIRQAGAQLIAGNPEMAQATPDQQVKWAESELRKLYPHYFGPPKQEAQAQPRQTVDGGGLGGQKIGDGFAKLPKEAKEVFQRYVKEGVIEDTKESRKEWADEYNAA